MFNASKLGIMEVEIECHWFDTDISLPEVAAISPYIQSQLLTVKCAKHSRARARAREKSFVLHLNSYLSRLLSS